MTQAFFVRMLLILSFQFMNKKAFLQELEGDEELTTLTSAQDWVKENKISIEAQLKEYGAVLFRNLPIENAEDFEDC